MSEHPSVFLNCVETSRERERVLALLHQAYMADHHGMSVKKAISALWR